MLAREWKRILERNLLFGVGGGWTAKGRLRDCIEAAI